MDYILLTKTIVEQLVQNKDAVSVKEYETDEENVTLIEVMVDSEDLGTVIGRGGKTIMSIRHLVQAASTINGGNKIKINVDSY